MLYQSTHLAGDGKPICTIDALNDAPDMLHGGHELRELVVFEVGQARDNARGYDEHVCGQTREITSRGCEGRAEGTDVQGRWA